MASTALYISISYVLKWSLFRKKHYSVCKVLTVDCQFEDRTSISFRCEMVYKIVMGSPPTSSCTIYSVVHLTRR